MRMVLAIVLTMLATALVLAFVRLTRGPSRPDRIIALDLFATISLGVVAVASVAADQPVLLDVAVALAPIVFLTMIAFAYYLGGQVDR